MAEPSATGVLRDGLLPARYAALLRTGLPAEFAPLVPFFADLSRLDTLACLLDRYLDEGLVGVGPAETGLAETGLAETGLAETGEPKPGEPEAGPRGAAVRVLNLGCGPLATELFCAALQGRQITSVDYTPAFVAFGHLLQAEGLLAGVRIVQGDVMAMDWPEAAFDAIILHDLLYEAAIDLHPLLARLSRALAPGGLIVLDVMDARVAPLWRLLRREHGYRRYALAEVEAALVREGLVVLDRRRAPPRAGLARRLMHLALRCAGLSNAVAFAARKAERKGGRKVERTFDAKAVPEAGRQFGPKVGPKVRP